jgi:hypothetical protein
MQVISASANWMEERRAALQRTLEELLRTPLIRFDEQLRSKLPPVQGIYAISMIGATPAEFLRAGKADVSLRQRIYQNHYMGDQSGNLRQQLIKEGLCTVMAETKPWIREHCRVQFLVIEDGKERTLAEHFMLALLQPKYADDGTRGGAFDHT